MRITLSPNEMRLACHHGVERYVSAMTRGANPKPNVDQPDNRMEVDLLSCMAELATAKALNVYWSGVEGINAPDVGGYEVRSTKHPSGKLIIRENDKPDQKVLLVTCDPPHFNIIGSILVRKGRQDNWVFRNERGSCWMVPQVALEKIGETEVKQIPSVDQDSWLFDM